MALLQFKRISPIPPPTEAEMVEMAKLMLEYLMAHPEEADELLEPEEPLPLETEFVDHQCPECRGWRLGFVPNADIRKVGSMNALPRAGHYLSCSRWKRYWPADRKDTLA